MRREDYAEEGTVEKKIVDLHFLGKSPSQIDEELGLPAGTAHDEIVKYWAYVKER